jgi:predicted TPR repeat methyltransferase
LLDGSSSTIALLKKQDETKEFQIHLNDIVSFLGDSPKDTFDLIVARHVLEHMDKNYLEKLIPLLERNLTENGSILIEVPNVGNFPY